MKRRNMWRSGGNSFVVNVRILTTISFFRFRPCGRIWPASVISSMSSALRVRICINHFLSWFWFHLFPPRKKIIRQAKCLYKLCRHTYDYVDVCIRYHKHFFSRSMNRVLLLNFTFSTLLGSLIVLFWFGRTANQPGFHLKYWYSTTVSSSMSIV